jgi:hypothetical protein
MNDKANIQKYIQFPLCYLQEIAIEPSKAIERAISYGVLKYGKGLPYSFEDVARQILYDFYHDKVSSDIVDFLTGYDIAKDEDYRGFDGGEFEPEDLKKLTEILEVEKHSDCIFHYQIHVALSFFNIQLGSQAIENYNEVEKYCLKHEQKFGKQPFPSMGLNLLFSFRDNPENIELLLAFAAIKSLIGQRNFTATNKDTIVMRMIGAKNKEALQEAIKNKSLKAIYAKYINRYWIDKLLNELLIKNFISSKVGFKRKLYISTTLNNSELALEVATFIKLKDAKTQEKQTRNLISQHLYNGTSI